MAESEASPDEQLELKKRARRRLVGATALALLAAIVLPMVMDREPRPPAQDIQVRIPSQDGSEFVSRVQAARPAQEVKSVSEPVSAAKPEPAPLPKQEAKPETKPEAKPDAAKPAAPAVTAASPAVATKPTEKSPDKPADKPAEKLAEKPAEKPAAAKAADGKAEEARAAEALSGGHEAWVVQLGAYKEAGNVKLLVSKLKGMGVPSYTEKFDTPHGPRTRVRAGPFPSRDAAEKARAKIKIVGVDGPVAPK